MFSQFSDFMLIESSSVITLYQTSFLHLYFLFSGVVATVNGTELQGRTLTHEKQMFVVVRNANLFAGCGVGGGTGG